MRFFFTITSLLLLALNSPVLAKDSNLGKVAVDLAEPKVEITTGFVGGAFQVYGVSHGDGDIAVVLRGPKRDMKVRRKDNILGAWINRSSVIFKGVPSYYDYAVSSDFSEQMLRDFHIHPEHLDVPVQKKKKRDEAYYDRYYESLLRNKRAESLYPEKGRQIHYLNEEEDFFKVEFFLPDNVPIGEYFVNVLYFENGALLETVEKPFLVEQAGMSGQIHEFSREHALIYGVLCVLLAAFAGWLSNRLRTGG